MPADLIECEYKGCGKRKAKCLMWNLRKHGPPVWVCRDHLKGKLPAVYEGTE